VASWGKDAAASSATGTVTERPLLIAEEVSKSFGGIKAVRNVDLAVRPGESVGLVGPNGAGKTTLFNCVCGQLSPDEGTIEFDGRQIGRLPTFRRAQLGIGRTYQRIEVFPELSVFDHLMVAERAHKGDGRLWKDLLNMAAPKPEERQRVNEVLELVGLTQDAETPVAALGLGRCRLVELARAVVAEPRLLLADEPSSGLDTYETLELTTVLRTLQREREMAVLLVEHDLGVVRDVSDRVVVMDAGEVVTEGPYEEVMADQRVRHAYLGQG
jgi:branched-chain amino acid transport system ATP-binding protein